MDLPIDSQRLRHYTRSRPRPNRTNRQPPSKPQEPAAESDNETNETMGRVDEGVEEFFTKKIIPDNPQKIQVEETLVKAQPVETASSAPPTGSSRNIKKKFGDFFAFKRVRARGAKSEGGPEGKVKKTSIADLIRPLREAARAEKEREREKEREKEKVEEEIVSRVNEPQPIPAPPEVEVPLAATSPIPVLAPATTPVSPATATPATPVSPIPLPMPSAIEREKSRTLEKSRTPDGERKLKATRRSLREGKSQSLILLTGLEPDEGGAGRQAKKHASEGPSSLEQRVHLMLHRIRVTKTLPPDPKKAQQSKEGELRKADSEGTIIDSKPEPPPTFTKPRTMSTSSDTRRPSRPATEKPPLMERPAFLPPKPAMKPALCDSPAALRTTPGTPSRPSSAPEAETSQPHAQEAKSPRRETPPVPSPRRTLLQGDSRERAERTQSVSEAESLPKPRPRLKPSPHRRAMSVHEESLREHAALLDPEELKAALPRLQRSPVRKRANLGELPPCSEDPPEGEEASDTSTEGSVWSEETSVAHKASEAGAGDGPDQGCETVTQQQQHSPPAATATSVSDQRTDPPNLPRDMN